MLKALEGMVFNELNKEPLPFANIVIDQMIMALHLIAQESMF